jgi:hypothetical protein
MYANESNLGRIPFVASGTNSTVHNAVPTIIPLTKPPFASYGATLTKIVIFGHIHYLQPFQ